MQNTRDPQRIHKVIGLIHSYWVKYPDLRFLQLIDKLKYEYNYQNNKLIVPDIFYLEDEDFEKFLVNLINK